MHNQFFFVHRWSPGMLPKVNKLVGIDLVRLRNCGLGPGKGVIAYYLRSLPQVRRCLGECRDLLFRRGA